MAVGFSVVGSGKRVATSEKVVEWSTDNRMGHCAFARGVHCQIGELAAMLSAQAYSFRQKSKLAISLSWVGGYVNVVAFMGCHTMVSHVTGSTTWFGQAVAGRHWGAAAFMLLILGAFAAG